LILTSSNSLFHSPSLTQAEYEFVDDLDESDGEDVEDMFEFENEMENDEEDGDLLDGMDKADDLDNEEEESEEEAEEARTAKFADTVIYDSRVPAQGKRKATKETPTKPAKKRGAYVEVEYEQEQESATKELAW
ncbi:hypothetical protein BC938DRAFT_478902, partial [Jimgerdemannia flammicorona]